jgi:hypothetical protein
VNTSLQKLQGLTLNSAAAIAAVSIASTEVSAQVITYLQAGQAALTKVKNLLDLGPANQLFAVAASQGEPLLAKELSNEACNQAMARRFEARFEGLGLFQKPSVDVTSLFVAQHPSVKQVKPVAEAPDTDPQLLKLAVAARTGLCTEYAALTAVLLAQEPGLKNQPFEILVCGCAKVSAQVLRLNWDKNGVGARGVGSPHVVTLLRQPGTSDADHANTVVLDAWTQQSAARLLTDTNYPADRPFEARGPFMRIIKYSADATPQISVRSDQSGVMHSVAFEQLPSLNDYRSVHGALMPQDLDDFIQQHHSEVALQPSMREWSRISADVSQEFFGPVDAIAQNTELLQERELHHKVDNAAADAAALYKSPSGSQLFEPVAITFPSSAATLLSPVAQAHAERNALTLAIRRDVT